MRNLALAAVPLTELSVPPRSQFSPSVNWASDILSTALLTPACLRPRVTQEMLVFPSRNKRAPRRCWEGWRYYNLRNVGIVAFSGGCSSFPLFFARAAILTRPIGLKSVFAPEETYVWRISDTGVVPYTFLQISAEASGPPAKVFPEHMSAGQPVINFLKIRIWVDRHYKKAAGYIMVFVP